VTIDPANYSDTFFLVDESGNEIVDEDGNFIVLDVISSPRLIRDTQETNLLAHSHTFEIIMNGNAYSFLDDSPFGKRILGWGIAYQIEREDRDETL
jgi:hypothetical protein